MATTLRGRVETALAGVISAASVGTTNIYKGFQSGDKGEPAVICAVKSAEEEPLRSGNYQVTAEVSVKGNAATDASGTNPLTAYETLAANVRNALWIDDLKTQLQNNATGLTVFGVSAPHKIDFDTEEDCWVERHTVEIYCCAYTFSA
jgi:hypothetical protein